MKSSDYTRMLQMIDSEDAKNPYTDQELAEHLKLSRSSVTTMRKKAGIENSRERREVVLLRAILTFLEAEPTISMNQLTKRLVDSGYRITLNSIINFVEQQNISVDTGKQDASPQMIKNEAFAGIIGAQRSLSIQVEQAKAAVMYPPIGLHTLIVGETGVGKSVLAEAMYKFALFSKQLEPKDMPFVELNCADYAENPQLLNAQLFGYQRGAFTGADEDREGLISHANGGILFLDEVHRMPPDGQEMLFQLIDKGVYRRLGDQKTRNAQVMIIAATTEDIETNLLDTFRRRIPMTIAIPSLSMRGIDEKYDIIMTFFHQEALRVNREIVITSDAMRRLLSLHYPGNVGELRSKIQVACAKGYLACMHKAGNNVCILIDRETLVISHQQLQETEAPSKEMDTFTANDLIVSPTDEAIVPELKIKDPNEFSDGLYRIIETEYEKLQNNDFSEKDINSIIWKLMEKKISRYISNIQTDKNVNQITDNIQTIVEEDLLKMVEEMLKVAKEELGEIDKSLLFCLATHFNASIERIRRGERILNPNLSNVKKHYPKEFQLAYKMAGLAKQYIGMELPDEEIGFIAMYLSATNSGNVRYGEAIGVIVVTHGRVAAEMVAVANELMGKSHLTSLCISLDESPRSIYNRLLEQVKKNNQGRGVLILVDMGSPETFGSEIGGELDIEVRTVTRVDTLMVLDAIRKTQLVDMDIDEVAESLIKNQQNVVLKKQTTAAPKRLAFVFFCLTGEGCAQYLYKHLNQEISTLAPSIAFIFLSLLTDQPLDSQIAEVKKDYHILGMAGSLDANTGDIPLFIMSEMHQTGALERFILRLKKRQMLLPTQQVDTLPLSSQSLIFMDQDFQTKEAAIQFLANQLVAQGYVKLNFIQTVIERENMVPTCLETGVAIPHGYFSEVIKPQIAILLPRKPIPWGNQALAKVVLLLAFTEETGPIFSQVYSVISDKKKVETLTNLQSKEEIQACLDPFYPKSQTLVNQPVDD
ncbi:sigma 54-interacting transcriptional regulator [Enterococcus sp. AZ163]|uniref:sigma 54-interacting transcriptional regulator n=1 Tax=Enterococcus sp. AZ163 TaxID=2774638 RepID=UPI003D26EFBE